MGRNANYFLKLLAATVLLSAVCCLGAEEQKPYYRIVVLSDIHYPVKETKIKNTEKAQAVIAAKKNVASVVNSWTDTNLIAVTGDIAGTTANTAELEAARQYLTLFHAPVCAITGNHDFMYEDALSEKGRLVRGTAEQRRKKLELCRSYYSIPDFCYTREANGYLLVFLSADSTTGKYPVELSPETCRSFSAVLAANRTKPTIVFFHAPLAGTIRDKKGNPLGNRKIAQPRKTLSVILKENPQVFLWISGHTHTPATNPSFMADYNLYQGTVEDIHNTDLNRLHTWVNSLYLYSDHVTVKTYSVGDKAFLPQFDRSFPLPAGVHVSQAL